MALTDKLAAIGLSLSAFIPSLFTNGLTAPIIGVNVSTVAGAVLGTYAAIGYDEVQRPRGKLFSLATATVILASITAGVVPRWFGWEWVNGGVEGGFAGLAALVLYYGLPEAIPAFRRLIRGFKLSDLAFFRKGAATPEPQTPPPPADGDPGK